MHYFIVGLGNPGEEHKETRHNVAREIISALADDWNIEKKLNALSSETKFGKNKVKLILPEGFMNNSGKSVTSLVKNKKALDGLVVVHDDLDLPLGTIKISFNRGSGGHRGLESIIRALKSKAFPRVRIGIARSTPGGKIKKPLGEKQVIDFILGKFSPSEQEIIKKVRKNIKQAIETVVLDGRERAMNKFN